jgi:hypothetical protein
MWNLGAFVQDDYKVTPHLTINVGFRYQYQGGWGEVQNRWGTFDPTLVNTGQYANNALGAMLYGGQGGRDIQDGANEWVPRFGLAWSPLPKWSFRASYGISDAPWSTDPYSAAYGIGLNPHGSEGYGTQQSSNSRADPRSGAVAYPTLATLTNSQYNYDDVPYFPEKRPVTYYQEALLIRAARTALPDAVGRQLRLHQGNAPRLLARHQSGPAERAVRKQHLL